MSLRVTVFVTSCDRAVYECRLSYDEQTASLSGNILVWRVATESCGLMRTSVELVINTWNIYIHFLKNAG